AGDERDGDEKEEEDTHGPRSSLRRSVKGARDADQDRARTLGHFGGRTYSQSTGWSSMPLAGPAIQEAILPGSRTGCMRERTHVRSVVRAHPSATWLWEY